MKKLPIVLCLMLLCTAVFNSRVYAAFIYDIDEFEQSNGTNTFTDTFSDTDEPEAPTYGVINPSGFGTGRESGGLLELNSDDAVMGVDNRMIAAGVAESTYHYSGAGHLIGKFEINDGDFPDSFLGIRISNFLTGFNEPTIWDGAMMGINVGGTGSRNAYWDDGSTNNLQNIDALWTTNLITMKLEIDGSNNVTAMWDFDSDGGGTSYDLTQSITTLSFNFDETGEYYTGAFMAGEPVPEPATVALLGIGLAGLGGSYVRRRIRVRIAKNNKCQISNDKQNEK